MVAAAAWLVLLPRGVRPAPMGLGALGCAMAGLGLDLALAALRLYPGFGG